jgi:hypothetical protein
MSRGQRSQTRANLAKADVRWAPAEAFSTRLERSWTGCRQRLPLSAEGSASGSVCSFMGRTTPGVCVRRPALAGNGCLGSMVPRMRWSNRQRSSAARGASVLDASPFGERSSCGRTFDPGGQTPTRRPTRQPSAPGVHPNGSTLVTPVTVWECWDPEVGQVAPLEAGFHPAWRRARARRGRVRGRRRADRHQADAADRRRSDSGHRYGEGANSTGRHGGCGRAERRPRPARAGANHDRATVDWARDGARARDRANGCRREP